MSVYELSLHSIFYSNYLTGLFIFNNDMFYLIKNSAVSSLLTKGFWSTPLPIRKLDRKPLTSEYGTVYNYADGVTLAYWIKNKSDINSYFNIWKLLLGGWMVYVYFLNLLDYNLDFAYVKIQEHALGFMKICKS